MFTWEKYPAWDYSVLQDVSPTLKNWHHPFLFSPTPLLQKKILNLSDTPFMSNPLKMLENLNPPLEVYPRAKKPRLIF